MAAVVPGQIPPPAPVLPAAGRPAAIVEISEGLARLTAGTAVRAEIAGRPENGIVRLTTELGPISLRTSLPLPPGTQVTLQIQPGPAGALRALIVPADRPAADAAPARAMPPAQPAPPMLRPGAIVPAQILGAPSSSPAPPLPAVAAAPALPASTPALTPALTPASIPAPGAAAAPAVSAPATAAPAAGTALPPGLELTIRITAVTPAPASNPAPNPASTAAQPSSGAAPASGRAAPQPHTAPPARTVAVPGSAAPRSAPANGPADQATAAASGRAPSAARSGPSGPQTVASSPSAGGPSRIPAPSAPSPGPATALSGGPAMAPAGNSGSRSTTPAPGHLASRPVPSNLNTPVAQAVRQASGAAGAPPHATVPRQQGMGALPASDLALTGADHRDARPALRGGSGPGYPAPRPDGAAASHLLGRPMTGQVAFLPPTGGAILTTPVGYIGVSGSGLPGPGGSIGFEILAAGRAANSSAITRPASLVELFRSWPALDEALSVMARLDPAATSDLLDQRIPQPGPRLATAAMFFVSVLRGGDLQGWLGGRAIELLSRAGRGELARRLGDEFAQMGRLGGDSSAGEWRGHLIPLYDAGQLTQLRLFLRDGEDESGDDPKGEGRRFLLDFELSRLGQMQLDGLVQGHRFSLIVRVESELPPDVRAEIAQIFDDGCACTGVSGEVSFAPAGELSRLPVAREIVDTDIVTG